MKVIISRLELLALIGKIQNVVPSKPAMPILTNVLIEAMDDQLIISATDLTVSMRCFADAKIEEQGSITLPARRFFHLIRELTAPMVEIHTMSPDTAQINAGSSHFKIQGMHKNEFPTLPDLTEGTHFSIATASLKELLCRSSFAAAREDNRYLPNGILLQNANQTATFIATDGKRLAKIHSTVDLPPEFNESHIVPLKAVEEMIRTLDSKEEEPVKITLMPDKIALELKSITLISKLLTGEFPDVGRVIPEAKQQAISLHREELMSLLRQVSLFTSEHSSSVRFTFTTGELHIAAMSGEFGEGKVQMPVNYAGEKLEIAFNPVYFLDILRHTKDEAVNFNVTDSCNPGLITDSSTAQFVIMPMRLE
jgi:DNA polymerase III subunit beta